MTVVANQSFLFALKVAELYFWGLMVLRYTKVTHGQLDHV
jgi:hypothetical protein